MEIIKQLRAYLQNIEEVQQITDFETEHNWEYEIVLDGLCRADIIAMLLHDCAKHHPIVEYDYFKSHSCDKGDMYLSIKFQKESK